MKFIHGLAALGSLATVSAQSCNADNCLRAMRSPERIAEARAFCGTYTTATASIPAFATQACTGNVASRVSSACSCIATTSAPATSVSTSPGIACGRHFKFLVLNSNVRFQLPQLLVAPLMARTPPFHSRLELSTWKDMPKRTQLDLSVVEPEDQQPQSLQEAQLPALL